MGAHPDHMRLRKRAQLPQSSIFRGGPNLLSSRIDALFWCGRELERLDHLCRLVNTSISAEQELIRGDRSQRSPAVMALCAHYIPLGSNTDGEYHVPALVFQKIHNNPSLVHAVP